MLSRLNPNALSFYPFSHTERFDTCTQGDPNEYCNNSINIIIIENDKANEDYKIAMSYAIILIISALLLKQLENIHCDDSEGKVASPFSTLKCLRLKNPNRIIIGHLNINSIRNKFDQLKYLINDTMDILLISETKLNNSFPENQFLIEGYSRPYRLDRTEKGGGIILYIREHIPSRKINVDFLPKIEGFFIEINLKKAKWLLLCSYNPHKKMIQDHVNAISRQYDSLSEKYENFLLLGDLNSEVSEDSMQDFCDVYNLKSLVKVPTCFKNPENPSCIDLILTNKPRCFQNTTVIESGLSDFHKFTVTVMKTHFPKQSPKVINYRNYKYYVNENFRNDFLSEIRQHNTNDMDCQLFEEIFLKTLDTHAPLKKRYVRANDAPYMNSTLRKAIMYRSKLRNKFLKTRTEISRKEYIKHRNYCVTLFRKEKQKFYNNLDMKLITDNRKFWTQVKPFFSDKTPSNNSIMLIENNDIISDNKKCAEVMNNFFSDVVEHLDIDRDLYTENVNDTNDPIIKAINKYKNHPSILKINDNMEADSSFNFHPISNEDIEKQLFYMNTSKAFQANNIPPKILKENRDIFSDILSNNLNNSICNAKFPDNLKYADITPAFKKDDRLVKSNYRPISILPTLSKDIRESVIQTNIPIF